MSAGSSPASAIARSTASAPISRAVRPDALVYAVSPMPTIATSPRTSSSSEACPHVTHRNVPCALHPGEFRDPVRDVQHTARRRVGKPHDWHRRAPAVPSANRRARTDGAVVELAQPRAVRTVVEEVVGRCDEFRQQLAEEIARRYGPITARRNPYVAACEALIEIDDRDRLVVVEARRRAIRCQVPEPACRTRRPVRGADRMRSSHAARPRSALLDRGGDARCDTSHEIEVVERCTAGPGYPEPHESAPRTSPRADDRRTDRAVEPAHREELVELGRQQLRMSRCGTCGTNTGSRPYAARSGVHGLAELFRIAASRPSTTPASGRGDRTLRAAACRRGSQQCTVTASPSIVATSCVARAVDHASRRSSVPRPSPRAMPNAPAVVSVGSGVSTPRSALGRPPERSSLRLEARQVRRR